VLQLYVVCSALLGKCCQRFPAAFNFMWRCVSQRTWSRINHYKDHRALSERAASWSVCGLRDVSGPVCLKTCISSQLPLQGSWRPKARIFKCSL